MGSSTDGNRRAIVGVGIERVCAFVGLGQLRELLCRPYPRGLEDGDDEHREIFIGEHSELDGLVAFLKSAKPNKPTARSWRKKEISVLNDLRSGKSGPPNPIRVEFRPEKTNALHICRQGAHNCQKAFLVDHRGVQGLRLRIVFRKSLLVPCMSQN